MQNELERVFTFLNYHFGEEELVYFPIAEQKWSEEEKFGNLGKDAGIDALNWV
ncbi:MAG: hypothetical protein ACK4I8_11925 [Armatimonadota bacterium]